jgi:hypothetical protein
VKLLSGRGAGGQGSRKLVPVVQPDKSYLAGKMRSNKNKSCLNLTNLTLSDKF